MNDYYHEGVSRGVKWGKITEDDEEVEVKPQEGVNVEERKHLREKSEYTDINEVYKEIQK